MPIDALSIFCAQLTRDLLAIAKFLFIHHGVTSDLTNHTLVENEKCGYYVTTLFDLIFTSSDVVKLCTHTRRTLPLTNLQTSHVTNLQAENKAQLGFPHHLQYMNVFRTKHRILSFRRHCFNSEHSSK